MVQLGEIRKGTEIGYKSRGVRYIWAACEICGKERWVAVLHGKPSHTRCIACAPKAKGLIRRGESSPSWKGGRRKTADGHVSILLQPDNFFYSMADKYGYAREHRLVVAKSLGRCLQSWEIVHHRNGVKDDNRIENLQVISELGHRQLTILEHKVDKLLQENQELKEEIKQLREENRLVLWHIKEREGIQT